MYTLLLSVLGDKQVFNSIRLVVMLSVCLLP